MDKKNIKETIMKWLSIAIAMFLIKMVILPYFREQKRQKELELEKARIETLFQPVKLYQRKKTGSDTLFSASADTLNVDTIYVNNP